MVERYSLIGFKFHFDNSNKILRTQHKFYQKNNIQFNRNDFLSIARFLDLINSNGLVHGDISCRNIILFNGSPKIIDWEPSGRQIFGNRIIAKASFKTKIVKTLKGTIQLTADYFAFYNLLKSSFYFIPEMETIFEQSLDSCLKLSLYTFRLEDNYKS